MLLAAALSLPLLAGSHEPLLPPPETFLLAPPPLPRPAPQGTLVRQEFPFFVSVGVHGFESELESPTGRDPESHRGFSADFGLVSWREGFGLALEGGVMVSTYDVKVSSLDEDDVDATRYLLGVRLIDANWSRSLLWYARAGAMYRVDEGDVIDDDGLGWYGGGGVEWRLGRFSLGPQVLYSETDSADSADWIFGFQGTLGF